MGPFQREPTRPQLGSVGFRFRINLGGNSTIPTMLARSRLVTALNNSTSAAASSP